MEVFGTPSFEEAKTLLSSCNLPTGDLTEDGITLFLGCRDEGVLSGVVGLQICGNSALLRSLAVKEASRGLGCGRRLVAAVEADASAMHVSDLYLLTNAATGFFEVLGFKVIARDAAPSDIRATAQFSSICPASATVMQKRLVA